MVKIGGKIMANERISVPPEKRGGGLSRVHALPHLTDENVMFGLRHRSAQERQRLREMLDMVGLGPFCPALSA